MIPTYGYGRGNGLGVIACYGYGKGIISEIIQKVFSPILRKAVFNNGIILRVRKP
jgi:hypothetical protein